jgi:hypothetical protein
LVDMDGSGAPEMVTRGDVESDDEGNGGISDAAETEAESTERGNHWSQRACV